MLTIQDENLCAEIRAIASCTGQNIDEVIKEMLEAYKDKHPLIFRN
jgi:hypothetical protein